MVSDRATRPVEQRSLHVNVITIKSNHSSLAYVQAPSTSQQRLLLTGADGAKPAKALAVAKDAARENGDSAVPVTANSANTNGANADGASPSGGASAAGAEAVPEEEEIPGQLVELKFRAPRAGKYDLTLYCISGGAPLLALGCPGSTLGYGRLALLNQHVTTVGREVLVCMLLFPFRLWR